MHSDWTGGFLDEEASPETPSWGPRRAVFSVALTQLLAANRSNGRELQVMLARACTGAGAGAGDRRARPLLGDPAPTASCLWDVAEEFDTAETAYEKECMAAPYRTVNASLAARMRRTTRRRVIRA
nr:hypothetical protein [Streptomyces sp. S1D4-11]QIZ01062.1 hypothetical protein HEP87_54670 [Streptomyces sp. S1D4-11]